jgi:hypothetical protein
MRDAGIERDQQRQRREHGRGGPYHRDDGTGRAALCQKSGDTESGCENCRGDKVRHDGAVGGGGADARQRSARQHQHVRIAADRPFGEHHEYQRGGGADRGSGRFRAPCHEQRACHE